MSATSVLCTACGQTHLANAACLPQQLPVMHPYTQSTSPMPSVHPQGFGPYGPGTGYPYHGAHLYPGQMPYAPTPMIYWQAPMTPSPVMRTQKGDQQLNRDSLPQSGGEQVVPGLSRDDWCKMIQEQVAEAVRQQQPTQLGTPVDASSPGSLQFTHPPAANTSQQVICGEMFAQYEAMQAELAALKAERAADYRQSAAQAWTLAPGLHNLPAASDDAQPSSSASCVGQGVLVKVNKTMLRPHADTGTAAAYEMDESTAKRSIIKNLLGPVIPLIHDSQTAMAIVQEFGDGEFGEGDSSACQDETSLQQPDPRDHPVHSHEGEMRPSRYLSLGLICGKCRDFHPTDTCGKLFQVVSVVHDRDMAWDDKKPGHEICKICRACHDLEAARRHVYQSHGKKQYYEHPENDLVDVLMNAAKPEEVMLIVDHYFEWPAAQKKVPMPVYCYFPQYRRIPKEFRRKLTEPLAPALRDIEHSVSDAVARLTAFSQKHSHASGTKALEEHRESEDSNPPERQQFVVSGRQNRKKRWRDSHWGVPK